MPPAACYSTEPRLCMIYTGRKVPIVATLVTFGISSLLGLLISGSLFSGNENHETKLALALFSKLKKKNNIKKKKHFVCIPMYKDGV